MPDFDTYYANNPVSVIDTNLWDDRMAEVAMQFVTQPTVYTPLVQWTDQSARTGAEFSFFTELLEGDVNSDPIALDAQYIPNPIGVDSRQRKMTINRYGDKVQLHESSNILQMYRMSGGRDWKPVLRGVLGSNIRRKMETLSRNIFLRGPKSFWTYAGGATDFAGLSASNTFDIDVVNAWNLRLGFTGTPVIPGEAGTKVVIVPPGVIYDFFKSLQGASANEAALWRDASLYNGKLAYELGTYKNTRFVQAPTDSYGINPAVLYNSGAITIQAIVSSAIAAGDGAPNPETTNVDDVWYVGQKAVTHYIQLKSDTDMSLFNLNDFVTIHTVRTSAYGVTNGVDPLAGNNVIRRIVNIDTGNKRLSFDRPVMAAFSTDLATNVFAYVTSAAHIGFSLAMGGGGGVIGNVNRPLKFYEPVAIDDFQSVWRFVWDMVGGLNMWEPNLFECHFSAVTLPKPGGLITPAGGS